MNFRSLLKPAAWIALIALPPYWLLVAPPYLKAEPIAGRVIDERTGKGVAGAVVRVTWVGGGSFGIGHSGGGGTLAIQETVSGSDGAYHIAGWGPRLRLPFDKFGFYNPGIVVFKPGYFIYSNGSSGEGVYLSKGDYFQGKSLALKPFEGNWPEYLNEARQEWRFGSCPEACPLWHAALSASR